MIDIKHDKDCVGCNGCVQRCPVQCISMIENEEGFRYPKVDVSRCINCHLCEKVCPVINQGSLRMPQAVCGAWNECEPIRLKSSSGGVFYALASDIISEGGVVFGARFDDNWDVRHDCADTLESIAQFCGSKYVQSRIDDSYSKAEKFLKAGRKVMFTGTPCQIAGLNKFLRKDYGELLFSVEVICHGVPSPLVWREYLKELTRPQGVEKNSDPQSTLYTPGEKMPAVAGISFRDKTLGWEKYGFTVHTVARKGDKNTDSQSSKLFETHKENLFMQCFLKDLCLRPSCYACPARSGKSGVDVTLGDFWNVDTLAPEINNDHKGLSLVLAYTPAGARSMLDKELNVVSATYEAALKSNPALVSDPVRPANYNKFRRRLRAGKKDIVTLMREAVRDARLPLWIRIKRKLSRLL